MLKACFAHSLIELLSRDTPFDPLLIRLLSLMHIRLSVFLEVPSTLLLVDFSIAHTYPLLAFLLRIYG